MKNKQEAIKEFICPACGNTDTHSIGYLKGKPYFLDVPFKGKEVEHKLSYPKNEPIQLSSELSPEFADKLI